MLTMKLKYRIDFSTIFALPQKCAIHCVRTLVGFDKKKTSSSIFLQDREQICKI